MKRKLTEVSKLKMQVGRLEKDKLVMQGVIDSHVGTIKRWNDAHRKLQQQLDGREPSERERQLEEEYKTLKLRYDEVYKVLRAQQPVLYPFRFDERGVLTRTY